MGGGKEGREENEKALFKKPSLVALYKDTSEWLTSRPGRSRHMPKQSRAHYTWRKRRRKNRGVHALSHPSIVVRPISRASQNSDPTKSANGRSICQTISFLRSVARKFTKVQKFTRQKTRMDQGD